MKRLIKINIVPSAELSSALQGRAAVSVEEFEFLRYLFTNDRRKEKEIGRRDRCSFCSDGMFCHGKKRDELETKALKELVGLHSLMVKEQGHKQHQLSVWAHSQREGNQPDISVALREELQLLPSVEEVEVAPASGHGSCQDGFLGRNFPLSKPRGRLWAR